MALLRSDVQKVIKALGKAEHHFWLVNYYEFSCAAGYITPDRHGIDPDVLCEGYHWNLCRCLAQAQEWEDLKHHIDIIKFDYLKKESKWTIQTASPRLYVKYWPEHDGVERPLTA